MPAGTRAPDRVVMVVNGLSGNDGRWMAAAAVRYARAHAPKLTGDSARTITPIYGKGYFGLRWSEERVWFQNAGVRPFLMRSLAGKTIPMWIDDPTGTERNRNPKAETRTTPTGRVQVLIFRRAANPRETKLAERRRRVNGKMKTVTVAVPKSYPGAPGRIATRPVTNPNVPEDELKSTGRIARQNVGIRWYFPGLTPRNFLQNGLVEACNKFDVLPGAIHIGYGFTPLIGSPGQSIPAYPRQPLGERLKGMTKGGVRSTLSS
jgi:hypothetical protein